MNLLSVREIFRNKEQYLDKEIAIGGWVRSIRDSKTFGFIVLNDGTFFEPIQVVYADTLSNFAEIGKIRTLNPASEQAQAMVAKLQNFITANFYNCTKQILMGLGQMYVADERFKENIDRAGGAGTAEFVAKAIEIYCK